MATIHFQGRTFDARPDRIDFRDRLYRPALESLPPCFPASHVVEQYLPRYQKARLVLDQGKEGACTGFGLAAVINYLYFRRALEEAERNGTEPALPSRVSTRMLYHMARLYDEWEGEDYEGSSCRGAMKGWRKHGVCAEDFWPYRENDKVRFIKPRDGWQQDAAQRPLGAYYRIDKDSIVDMQAALLEVGAIYVSASVHEGWYLDSATELPIIELREEPVGGHAFALVGYTADGFIVQNSWGGDWGFHGFAILQYPDWVKNGNDAWVAVMGAPMRVPAPASVSSVSLQGLAAGEERRAQGVSPAPRAGFQYRHPDAAPWSEERAYRHTLVMGNDGRVLNRLIDVENAEAAITEVLLERPQEWLARRRGQRRLALYAHGGLNDEAASVARIRIMAPYYEANGIYPLFLTWRTGFMESIQGIIEDAIDDIFGRERFRAAGWDLGKFVKDARDRAIEAVAERILVKPIWTQMKQNADAAADRGNGLWHTARALEMLKARWPELRVHLVGHSAGSILLGHLLERTLRAGLPIDGVHLYAPACTMGFANRTYGRAMDRGLLRPEAVTIDNLTDERERADSVGPYGKSLLYLVSRALEVVHKMPLLGLAAAWNEEDPSDLWNRDRRRDIVRWMRKWGDRVTLTLQDKEMVFDGQTSIPAAHGAFDNDVEVVTRTLERIRGGPLKVPVENLHGF